VILDVNLGIAKEEKTQCIDVSGIAMLVKAGCRMKR
jgi:hypothetical protein